MDEAGRFTAEHSVMEAGIEIRELKHLLEIAEDKIRKLEKELTEVKSVKEQPELKSVISEKYSKFGEDA